MLDYQQRHKIANHTIWLHEEHDLSPLYCTDDIEYLRSLPEYLVLGTDAGNILFTHYAYPNLSGLKKEFYTYGVEFKQHFEFMKEMDCRISFAGHSHVRGFFMAGPGKLRQYRYMKKTLSGGISCVGVPPVTRKGRRSGITIFDTDDLSVHVIRI